MPYTGLSEGVSSEGWACSEDLKAVGVDVTILCIFWFVQTAFVVIEQMLKTQYFGFKLHL